jgi:8-oxo-dGTP pyrophosphatase MutT (NUDIX family)
VPKHERSAGVIVFRKSLHKTIEFLLLNSGRFWGFPKGHLEKGETDAGAALRELREETGITDAQLISGFAHEIRYFYRAGKGLIDKTVVFFIAETQARTIQLSDEHVDFKFLAFEQARQRLAHANSRHLLETAHEFLTPRKVKSTTK